MQTDGVLAVSKPHLKKRFFFSAFLQVLFLGFSWILEGGSGALLLCPDWIACFFSENMEFGSMGQL